MTNRMRRLAARLLIPLFLLGLIPSRPAHAILPLPFLVPLGLTGYSGAGAVSFASVAATALSALIGGSILALAITPSTAEAPTDSAVRIPTTDTGYSSDAMPPPPSSAPPLENAYQCWRAVGDEQCYPTAEAMCTAYGGVINTVWMGGLNICKLSSNPDTYVDVETMPNGSLPLWKCNAGYSFSSQQLKCVLANTREIESDNKIDYTRSGTEVAPIKDIDSGNQWLSSQATSTNGGTNNAVVVSGASESGQPRRVVVEAAPEGGSRVVIQDQKTDAAGNSYLQHKTLIINQAGTVTGVSTHSTAQSLNAVSSTNAQTGTTTTTYEVVANPAATYSPAVAASGSTAGTGSQSITFPSDYARQGEAQSAANSTNARIDAMKLALLEASPAPTDPAIPEWSFFDGTFAQLLGWSLPSHSSQCPTGSFGAFDRTYTIDAHCNLVASHWSALQAAMSVVWLIAALFIVLAA